MLSKQIKAARTASLQISYEQIGPDHGRPILLLHGWPYSPRSYDAVCELLASPERRLIVPFLRGFGPTRYLSEHVFRSGQQAALGKDLIDLMDALGIGRATLVGYDWGGRAACVAAALWPERVCALLAVDGYAIQEIADAAVTPGPVEMEYQYWYQWYFQTDRGRAGLEKNRKEIAHKLWEMWSPEWSLDEGLFDATATAFENPDFVATTIHSYRHRYRNAPGDPALEELEARLAEQPVIAVPTLVIQGKGDRVLPPSRSELKSSQFTGVYERVLLPGVGHCPPQESPREFARGLEKLLAATVDGCASSPD